MTTARDMVKRALRMIRVTPGGTEPSAEDAQDALQTLNRLLSAFPAEGLDYTHTTATLDDTITIDNVTNPLTVGVKAGMTPAVEAVLALQLCIEYGMDPSATLAASAGAAWKALEAALINHDETGVDTGFQRLPSRFRSTGSLV